MTASTPYCTVEGNSLKSCADVPRNVTSLVLDGRGIYGFASGVFDALGWLEELSVRHNSITFIQATAFRNLTLLQALYLDYNPVGSIDVIDWPPLLATLGLGGWSLTVLPTYGALALPSLRALLLNDNALTSIPVHALDGLSSLQTLRLDGNYISSLPQRVLEGKPELQQLVLSRNRLTVLPGGAFGATGGLARLSTLDVSFNRLSALPDLASLTALTTLRASNNSIGGDLGPQAFGLHGALRELDLASNSIRGLASGALDNLGSLQVLDLSNNSIASLPADSFPRGGMPDLRELRLGANPVADGCSLGFCRDTLHLDAAFPAAPTCTLAAPGTFCNTSTPHALPCAAGWFGNSSGLSDPFCSGACPVGCFCPPGSSEPTPCPADTFGAQNGLASCSPCPVGTGTGGLIGSTSYTACKVGQFHIDVGTLGVIGACTAVLWAALWCLSSLHTQRLRRAHGKRDSRGQMRTRDYTRLLSALLGVYHLASDCYFLVQHTSASAGDGTGTWPALTPTNRVLVVIFGVATMLSFVANLVLAIRMVQAETRQNPAFREWLHTNVGTAGLVITVGSTKISSMALLRCGVGGFKVFDAPVRPRTMLNIRIAAGALALLEDAPQLVCSVAVASSQGQLLALSNISTIACGSVSLLVQIATGLVGLALSRHIGDASADAAPRATGHLDGSAGPATAPRPAEVSPATAAGSMPAVSTAALVSVDVSATEYEWLLQRRGEAAPLRTASNGSLSNR